MHDEAAPDPIRVVVANLSGIMSELIVSLIRQETDFRLMSEVQNQEDLVAVVKAGADLVVLSVAQPEILPEMGRHLLGLFPNLKILVLTENGGQGMLYWLGLRRNKVRNLSTQKFLTSLRQAQARKPLT